MTALTSYLDERGPQALQARRALCRAAEAGQITRDEANELGYSRKAFERLGRDLPEIFSSKEGALLVRREAIGAVSAAAACDLLPPPLRFWSSSSNSDDRESLLRRIEAIVESRPAPKRELDHVPATPKTLLRRLEYLSGRFDLSRTRLLFLGDHDLTSLALLEAGVIPPSNITVVDIDDDLLDHIAHYSRVNGAQIRCAFADLRVSMPAAITGFADVVFSDPPYTPEGVGLFAARAIQALRDDATGRIVLAYGYADLSPTLGHNVQERLENLRLIFDVVLPAFNRYLGAEAIASRAALYELRLTRRSRRSAQRLLEREEYRVYTHKGESSESKKRTSDLHVRLSDSLSSLRDVAIHEALEHSHAGESSASVTFRSVEYGADYNLVRDVLRCESDFVFTVVPNNTRDIRDERGQKHLAKTISPKYEVCRLLRNVPDDKHATLFLRRRTVCDRTNTRLFEQPELPSGEVDPSVSARLAPFALVEWPRVDIDKLASDTTDL